MILMRTRSLGPVHLKMLPVNRLLSAPGPLLMLAIHVILVTLVLAGGSASASVTGTEINETASLRLASTGLISSPLTAFASARLHISEQGMTNFLEVRAHGESGRLSESGLYALEIVYPEGNAFLVDTARADEECEEENSDECEVVVELRVHIAPAPSNITTPGGLTINIQDLETGGQVLATGTVAALMITSSTTTSAM